MSTDATLAGLIATGKTAGADATKVEWADLQAILERVDTIKANNSEVTSPTDITGWESVKDNGAVGDGTTNDTAAFTTAIATGKPVYVPDGTYKVDGNSLTLGTGQTIFGNGDKSVIKCLDNNTALQMGNNSRAINLKFTGSGVSGANAQKAINLNGISYAKVLGCTFFNIAGTEGASGGGGIFTGQSGNANYYGSVISDCHFLTNNVGINVSDRGEYSNVSNCTFIDNTIGVYYRGGNVNFGNCIIIYNATGIKMRGGTNHAHSVFSGCAINHNTVSLDIDSVIYGHQFSGCMLYYGNGSIVNSVGIRFTGCDIDALTLTNTTTTNGLIVGSRVGAGATIAGTGWTQANNVTF